MLKAPLAVAIFVATFGQMAFAEEARVTKLDQVVVTASRSESSVSDVSGTVQVISREEIVQQSQTTVQRKETLRPRKQARLQLRSHHHSRLQRGYSGRLCELRAKELRITRASS